MSNLNDLNQILFDTLRDVKDDKIDPKKAQAIVGLSNSIINNGKLQLNAYKMAKSEQAPKIFGLPEKTISQTQQESKEKRRLAAEKNRHEAMSRFANEKGYKNVADGIAQMTKTVFMAQFENWMNQEQ